MSVRLSAVCVSACLPLSLLALLPVACLLPLCCLPAVCRSVCRSSRLQRWGYYSLPLTNNVTGEAVGSNTRFVPHPPSPTFNLVFLFRVTVLILFSCAPCCCTRFSGCLDSELLFPLLLRVCKKRFVYVLYRFYICFYRFYIGLYMLYIYICICFISVFISCI